MKYHTREGYPGAENWLWTLHEGEEEAKVYATFQKQGALAHGNKDFQIEGYKTLREHEGWHPRTPAPVGMEFSLDSNK